MDSATDKHTLQPPIVLHGYWRSGTSYRTRLALEYKGLSYTQVTHDLRHGGQHDEAYLMLNPQGLVPTVQSGATTLTQSSAIIEWLEEIFPTPALLPKGRQARAVVRSMAMTIACDIHPLNNLRVLNKLRNEFNASEAQVQNWIARWIHSGFGALEPMIVKHGGTFCFGDDVTTADCHLIPQVYFAERFDVSLESYPKIRGIAEAAAELHWVKAAHPDYQPDSNRGHCNP